MKQTGCLIVFEGIDGSGKSTQIQLLKEKLQQEGRKVYQTMEPSDGYVGKMIREILRGEKKTDLRVMAKLFTADRLDHLLNEENGLLQKIEQGEIVLCDRYYMSSFAYQSVDMDMELIIECNRLARELLKPAMHIFIDIDAETAMDRIRNNRDSQELFETKERLRQTRIQYMKAFDRLKDSETVIIIDGKQKPEKIAEQVWDKVKQAVE